MGHIEANFSRSNGHSYAEVPHSDIWNLVEYLSYQRTPAEYAFHDSHITVTFHGLDQAQAQKVLDEWCQSSLAAVSVT